MDERQRALEEVGMALVMRRVLRAGLPPEVLGWMLTERGLGEVRCHFRRTWRALEAETWQPMKSSLAPTPAERLIKTVEDAAKELWLAANK